MDNKPQITASISDAEMEILNLLWESAPRSAQDIIDALQAERQAEVHPKTVKTLINRLLKKEVISYTEQQRKLAQETARIPANPRVRIDRRITPAVAALVEQSKTATPLRLLPQRLHHPGRHRRMNGVLSSCRITLSTRTGTSSA